MTKWHYVLQNNYQVPSQLRGMRWYLLDDMELFILWKMLHMVIDHQHVCSLLWILSMRCDQVHGYVSLAWWLLQMKNSEIKVSTCKYKLLRYVCLPSTWEMNDLRRIWNVLQINSDRISIEHRSLPNIHVLWLCSCAQLVITFIWKNKCDDPSCLPLVELI